MDTHVADGAGPGVGEIGASLPDAPAMSLASLRGSPDGMVLLNPAGRIGFVNAIGLSHMRAASAAAVRGWPWWMLWPGKRDDALRASVDRAAAGELVDLRAGGCDVTLSPVRDPDGRVESILVTSRRAG